MAAGCRRCTVRGRCADAGPTRAWLEALIGQQAPVDGVRQPAFQAPQRFLGRLASAARIVGGGPDGAALLGEPSGELLGSSLLLWWSSCRMRLSHDPRWLDFPSCRAFVPLRQDRRRVASRSMKIWIPDFGVAEVRPLQLGIGEVGIP